MGALRDPAIRRTRAPRAAGALLGALGAGALAAACSIPAPPSAGSGSRVVRVVAAEDVWGSVADQLGGLHARVTSIISNPDVDPHSYEPTPRDARTIAGAAVVIENGLGYDPWFARLLAADDTRATVVDVGALLGLRAGANPHRWYNPADLHRVIRQLTADYAALDPRDAGYFTERRSAYETVGLAPYTAAIGAIRARFGGTPVGASESIFAMLAPALGLDLVTPPGFMRAVSEGNEVSAADEQTIDAQISNHRIALYVYNSQNLTPEVQGQLERARAAHIPVARITETLSPARTSYQAWQTRQLDAIAAALARSGAGVRP